jgi:hypothetical protein
LFFLVIGIGFTAGCNYLDIVPDNVATMSHAFSNRAALERYLFTCYSYFPDEKFYIEIRVDLSEMNIGTILIIRR